MDISTWPLLKCQLIIRQRYASPVCHTKSCLFGNLRSQCLDGYFSKHADCSWPYILVSVWLVATYCLSNSVVCCGTLYIKSCYLWLCKQVVHEKAWWKALFGYQQFFLRFLKFWQSNRATSNLINKWFALDSQVRPASRRFIIAAITELKHLPLTVQSWWVVVAVWTTRDTLRACTEAESTLGGGTRGSLSIAHPSRSAVLWFLGSSASQRWMS